MQLILLEKIQKLGDLGDTVNVKPGFGRNYLVPQGKAVPATKENLAAFEARRAELEQAAEDRLTQATGRRRALTDVCINITANASEEGKLYGSIGPREVADAVTAAGHTINKSEVVMGDGPIRMVGEYDVLVHLHADVEIAIKVIIAPE
jgi:large subunit ribosomal protein L9